MKRFLFCIIFFVSSLHCFSGWDLINPLWIGFWGALKAMSHQFMPVTQKDLRKNQQEMLDMLNNRAKQVQQAALSEIDILFDNCKNEIETTLEPKIDETYSSLQQVKKGLDSMRILCEKNISTFQAHNSKKITTFLSAHFSHIKEETREIIEGIDNFKTRTAQDQKNKIDLTQKLLQELLQDTQKAKQSLLLSIQKQKTVYDKSLAAFHEQTVLAQQEIEKLSLHMNKDRETITTIQSLVADLKEDQRINIQKRLRRFEKTLSGYKRLVTTLQPIKPEGPSRVKVLDRGSNHI